MQGAYLLATLSVAMFVGSYLAGSIPLMFNLSQNRVRLFSIFGAGLLVGTALSVIIPEGVESLYAAQMESYKLSQQQQQHRGEAGAALILEKSIDNAAAVAPPRVIPKDAQLNKNLNVVVDTQESRAKRNDFDTLHLKRQLQQALPVLGSLIEPDVKEESHHKEFGMLHEAAAAAAIDKNDHESAMHEHIQETSVHKAIGFSLIIGFILMLIIDQGTRSAASKAGERQRFKMTATIGLVVHAAADGVALGSASATDRTDVQFIVFLAIMLHKAPAAFGLVSFLLVEGLERVRVRRHLLVFSSAAPITALLTFYAIIAVGSESLSSGLSTGVLMLFSAGTFLYVATVHVLPELVNSSDDYQLVGASGNIAGHSHTGGGPSFTIKELATIIIGALLPAVLASHHSH